MNTGHDLDKRLNVIESAVYLLFEKDIVVYVGESGNPLSRIGTHIKQKVFTSYRILKCHPDRRRYWEKVLILKYQPRYNKTYKKKWTKDNVINFPLSDKYPIKTSCTTSIGAYVAGSHISNNPWVSTSTCASSHGIGTTSATLDYGDIYIDGDDYNTLRFMSASGGFTIRPKKKPSKNNKGKNNQKKSAVN